MKKILFAAAIISIFNFQFSILKAQQPDAQYKLLRYEWTVNADGTSDFHYRHEVQILRNRALTAYADKGETFVTYNPDLETLTINEVYTIQHDGTRIDMPQNAFVYQLPSECADCGRFNHMRELAMVHTGMEIGCVIVVDYTIHRQYDLLYEYVPLQRECPIEKLEVVVNNKSSYAVNYDTIGKQYLPTAGSTPYTFRNIPQAPREPFMPADIIPTLHIFNGAPEHTPAFDQQPFNGAADVVGQLMKSGDAKEDITHIRNYVVDNIHLNDIHPSHLGYVHSTPFEVWATGCGTATDKAVFLAAILNNEGYTARVMGDNYDQVGVMIDTVEYLLDVRHKDPIKVNGEAKDEVFNYDVTTTIDITKHLDTLTDGFFALHGLLPMLPGDRPNAKYLTVSRTTPLVGEAVDVHSDVTFTLPKGFKLVGWEINQSFDFPGIGNMKFTVKQSGKKLRVIRNLKIEKSVIDTDEYSRYRQLLTTWQELNEKDYLFRVK